MLTDIFLIRHGYPLQNTGLAYHTPPGPGLSETGRNEARQAAAFLADKALECLFVSPFDRTTQTAEEIIERLDIPIHFTQLIQEHGPSESFEQVRARFRAWLTTVEDSGIARMGIVSHGSPIRAALLELSQAQIDLRNHVYHGNNPAPTAGVWHARRNDRMWCLDLVFKPAIPLT